MSNPVVAPKKNKKILIIGIIAVVLIIIIAVAALSYNTGPTMSSLAGTYIEQVSSGTGYTVILYANGTGVFSTYHGTWSLLNSTTIQATYTIISVHTSYFTITSNGLISDTGKTYLRQ
jgi:hypothetical protein